MKALNNTPALLEEGQGVDIKYKVTVFNKNDIIHHSNVSTHTAPAPRTWRDFDIMDWAVTHIPFPVFLVLMIVVWYTPLFIYMYIK